jgi:hypothetical protein
MTAIKARRVSPRPGTSSQNGQPELVPYVYGQQTRRNAHAERIAQQNVDGTSPRPADSSQADSKP